MVGHGIVATGPLLLGALFHSGERVFFDYGRIFSAIAPGIALPPTSTSMDGGNAKGLSGTTLALWSNTGDDFDGTATFCELAVSRPKSRWDGLRHIRGFQEMIVFKWPYSKFMSILITVFLT